MLNTWRAQGGADGFEGGAGAGAGVRMVTLVPGSAGAQMPVLNAAGQGMPMPMCLPALHAPEQGAPVACFLSRFNSVWPAGILSFQPEFGPQARAARISLKSIYNLTHTYRNVTIWPKINYRV